MYFEAENTVTKNILLEVVKFVDGDGFFAKEVFSNREHEIRLYGIDAPEMKVCPKLLKDEKELQIPASLLIKFGYMSFEFLKSIVGVGDKINLIQELNNQNDRYGRLLGYAILDDGKCLNEIMVSEGFAKPYNDCFCLELPKYQSLSMQAKTQKKGIFAYANHF
jgi:micrococcal nuclease